MFLIALATALLLADRALDSVGPSHATAIAGARDAGTAIEMYANDHGGVYAGADEEALAQIDPQLGSGLEVSSTPSTYSITVRSSDGTAYSIWRGPDGVVGLTCVGGC